MFKRYSWILIGVLLFLANCGGSSHREDVTENLVKAREQVEQIANTSEGDPDREAFVETAKKQLKEADHMVIEDDYEGALIIANQILADADQLLSGEAAGSDKLSFGQAMGLVRVDRGQGMEQLGLDARPEPGMVVETGVRSGVVMRLFSGSNLALKSSSKVHIDRIKGRSLSFSLDSGSVALTHKGGSTSIAFRDHKFLAEKVCVIELGSANGLAPDYVSVLSGTTTWVGGGIEGSLMTNQALTWTEGARVIVDVPNAPIQDAPGNNRNFTVATPQSNEDVRFEWHSRQPIKFYELQVAKSKAFEELVHEGIYNESAATVSLSPGLFFWRIRALSDDQIPGSYSPISQFRVEVRKLGESATARSDGPPILNPQIEVIADSAIVKGRSSKGTMITVNGVKAVMMGDGTFSVIVNFKRPGTQWVEIVARDSKGGESMSRHMVEVDY